MRRPANFNARLVAFENVCCNKKNSLKEKYMIKSHYFQSHRRILLLMTESINLDRAAAPMQIKFYFTGVKINYKRQTFENKFSVQ